MGSYHALSGQTQLKDALKIKKEDRRIYVSLKITIKVSCGDLILKS